MKLEFKGSRALITGGTSDLAISTAEILIEAGLSPALTCRDKKGRNKIESGLKSYGDRYYIKHIDYDDPGSVEQLFNEAPDGFHYLIDLAHSDFENLIASAEKEMVYKYFDINISFRAELIKWAARAMLKQRFGRFVFLSSTSAVKANPGQGFYAAAKLASEALYRNLGLEMGVKGVTAVTLRTAYIYAGRGKNYFKTNENDVIKSMPIGRILSCREVAEAIVFFISDSALGFNATEVSLDGGFANAK